MCLYTHTKLFIINYFNFKLDIDSDFAFFHYNMELFYARQSLQVYSEMSKAFRPSHADVTYDFKYGLRSIQVSIMHSC